MPECDNYILCWIWSFQTLIAGLLALLAAAITVCVIIMHHRETISRRRQSARSNLPLALSELHDYASHCVDALSAAMCNLRSGENIRRELPVPPLPRDSLQTITELIEFSKKRDVVFLQAILRFIQVQRARLIMRAEDIYPDRRNGSNALLQSLQHDVLDACILRMMADHLFPFARREAPHITEFDETKKFTGLAYGLQFRYNQTVCQYVQSRLISNTKKELETLA